MEKFIKNLVNEARKDKEILAVVLFGSYARGEKYRDVDVALVLNEKKSNKKMSAIRLEYLSKFGSKFDLHVFQHLPIYIKSRILKEGKFVMVRKEDVLYEVAFQVMKEFGFYKKIYYNYLNSIK